MNTIIQLNNTLYILKRMIKESTIDECFVKEYMEYIGADSVLKENRIYYFCQKIDEAKEEFLELEPHIEK